MFLFLCEGGLYSTDVVELEPVGLSHWFDVCGEQQGVVQGHGKILCTVGGRHSGEVCDTVELSTVLERAGLPREEGQLCLVELNKETEEVL